MTYTKITNTIPGLADTVAQALAQHAVAIDGIAGELLDAGATVQLETGDKVWVSCVVHDRPETPQIDFLTVVIACHADMTPWCKENGQLVCNAYWHGEWPDNLAALGIDTLRRALMMVALGEAQPQVDIPSPAEGGPTQQDAIPGLHADAHSIRTAITAAGQLSAPLTDVL